MDKWTIVAAAAASVISAMCTGLLLWINMRKKYIAFVEDICKSIDTILRGDSVESFILEDETLISRVQMRLKRLADITEAAAMENEEQKKEVQSIVSDISHQLKTPIANITMYCDTARQKELPEATREQCLEVMGRQVGKLEFLIQSLVKMSRLETNMITITPGNNCLRNTLYEVAESVRVKAEQKGLEIEVECPKEIYLYYDAKWTAEAIFNIVDNSVKYTEAGGKIRISAEPLEIYTKIVVEDNGSGIAPEHINDVCKRFFREGKASSTEGVGIGLYLTREIIMKQNGYLKIQSHEGAGTKVALYILNMVNAD